MCHMALGNWHLIAPLAGGLNPTIRHLPQARGPPKVTTCMGTGDCKATQRFPLSSSWVRASLTPARQAGLTVAACPWAPEQQLPHLHRLLGHLASFRETGGGRCPLGTDFCLHLLSLVCLLPLWMDSSLGILTTWHSSFAQVFSSGP